MGIYEKNMSFLEKAVPILYEQIQNCDKIIELEQAKNGQYTIKIENNDKKVYLYSKYDPDREVQRWAEGLDLESRNIILQIGFGLGYHTQKLLENHSDIEKIIIIEPNIHVFKTALHAIDLLALSQKAEIDFIIGYENRKIFRELFEVLSYKDMQNAKIIEFEKYCEIYKEAYESILQQAKEVMQANIVQLSTIVNFDNKWIFNPFQNTVSILSNPGVNCLCEVFKNRPAIIVSGGPSLDKNIHLIKEAKEKAAIIAGVRTLPALLNQNIKPDLLVSIDPGQDNMGLFMPYLDMDIPLIYNAQTPSGIIENYEGPTIIGSFQNKVVHFLRDALKQPLLEIPDSPSVAACSVLLAEFMGCNTIILIGQDLAYTGLKSHAKSALKGLSDEWQPFDETENTIVYKNIRTEEICTVEMKNYESHKKIIYSYHFLNQSMSLPDKETDYYTFVKGSHEEKVPTTHQLHVYLSWFKGHIGQTKGIVQLVNATEGGAYMDGAHHCTFQEAIKKYCIEEFNPSDVIKSCIQNEKAKKHDYINAYNELNKLKKSLQNIIFLSKEGFHNAKRMEQYYAGKANYKINSLLKKADKIDEELSSEKAIDFINELTRPLVIRLENTPGFQIQSDDAEELKGEKVSVKSQIVYEQIEKTAHEMESLIKYQIAEVERNLIIKVFECTIRIS